MLEASLNDALRRAADLVATQPLRDALHYALFPGGKRLRPAICFMVLEYLGRKPKDSDYLAAATLELIHVSSLVHDDLPAIDNDDMRRGRPSVHRAFNEATAVLCGDALLGCAFEVIGTLSVAADKRVSLVCSLAKAFRLICEGQQADLHVERGSPLRSVVDRMKTAALFRCSSEFGAILHGAPREIVDAAGEFGERFGILFQLLDDRDDGEGVTLDSMQHAHAGVQASLTALEQAARRGEATPLRDLMKNFVP